MMFERFESYDAERDEYIRNSRVSPDMAERVERLSPKLWGLDLWLSPDGATVYGVVAALQDGRGGGRVWLKIRVWARVSDGEPEIEERPEGEDVEALAEQLRAAHEEAGIIASEVTGPEATAALRKLRESKDAAIVGIIFG